MDNYSHYLQCGVSGSLKTTFLSITFKYKIRKIYFLLKLQNICIICHQIKKSFSSTLCIHKQARNQQFAMGGGGGGFWRRQLVVWGWSPLLPEAGIWGHRSPAAEGTGVWERSLQFSKFCIFLEKIT